MHKWLNYSPLRNQFKQQNHKDLQDRFISFWNAINMAHKRAVGIILG